MIDSLNLTSDFTVLALLPLYFISMTTQVSEFINTNLQHHLNQYKSVDRLRENLNNTSSEAEFRIEGLIKPKNWPQKGKIELQNISLRYAGSLPRVIKNLSFNVESGQNVAIVGRAGSGKSTVLLGLMRILEICENADKSVGRILIDGFDIYKLGLHDLRAELAIIPQDPFILEGTLRKNLDPEGKLQDEEIKRSLQLYKIWDFFTKMAGTNDQEQAGDPLLQNRPKPPRKIDEIASNELKSQQDEIDTGACGLLSSSREKAQESVLDQKISSEGKNLSIGQKQLICITRALIKNPKILLMDEATSNIDQKTDSTIQSIFKKHLKRTTVFTIAHRLQIIIQYDKIIVLSKGQLLEQGSPYELLTRKGSMFSSMVDEEGPEFRKKMLYCAKNKSFDPNDYRGEVGHRINL